MIDVLAEEARAAIEIPLQAGQGAPYGDLDAPMITQLPTWLWIDAAIWGQESAETDPVFGFTVTATATPINVTFATDAGDTVDCGANTGPPYNFAFDDSRQHSDCTLTYRHSSAVGAHTLSSTIYWAVSYTCTLYCSGPIPLEPFIITTTREVRVAEFQAIATANR